MAIVTNKSLQQQIDMLKAMNECYSKEINKLNAQINIVKIQYDLEREEYLKQIEELKMQIKCSEIKLNERNAGRKAYSNKQVIEKIYKLYLSGMSLQGIADELKRLEIKTNRGRDWSKSSIRFILVNSANAEKGLVERDIYERAVKLLNVNRR